LRQPTRIFSGVNLKAALQMGRYKGLSGARRAGTRGSAALGVPVLGQSKTNALRSKPVLESETAARGVLVM
jgi:hypothetical protein